MLEDFSVSAGLLAPLARFCAERNLPVPEIQLLEAEQLPEPARTLLAHNGDMTPRLEAFRNDVMYVKPLAVRRAPGCLSRMVVLLGEETGVAAEFGAIDIFLDAFPEPARQEICGLRTPLGTILGRFEIPHHSEPAAWFAVRSDRLTSNAFGLKSPQTLFGRRNRLVHENGDVLAEIVEILPPS